MSYEVFAWLAAVAAVVVLARLRGKRGIKALLGWLLLVFLAVMVWNISVNFRSRP